MARSCLASSPLRRTTSSPSCASSPPIALSPTAAIEPLRPDGSNAAGKAKRQIPPPGDFPARSPVFPPNLHGNLLDRKGYGRFGLGGADGHRLGVVPIDH